METLHSLLIQIQQSLDNDSSLISSEQVDQLFNLLRKGENEDDEEEKCSVWFVSEYPLHHPNALILAPILYSARVSSVDLTSKQRLSDGSHLSTSVVRLIPSSRGSDRLLQWQMNGTLADVILEMGYDFTGSIEDCRNALVHFGLQELKASTIARILAAMIRTHSGLSETTRIYVSTTDNRPSERFMRCFL